jgi:prepilin-type N-terminal cleavage/methylation domain
MQISTVQLNKGFTLLEIIIVLTIISLASTSFYLLLRQPAPEYSLMDKITHLQENSLYTGSTFSFTKDSINIYKMGEWVKFEDFDTSYVQSYEDINGNNKRN